MSTVLSVIRDLALKEMSNRGEFDLFYCVVQFQPDAVDTRLRQENSGSASDGIAPGDLVCMLGIDQMRCLGPSQILWFIVDLYKLT